MLSPGWQDLPVGEPETRPLRVLWLIKGLGPGGAEQLLVSFAKVRDRERFRYHAAYIVPWKTALVPDLEDLGITVHALGGARRIGLAWPWRLRRLLRALHFDVIHLHSPSVAAAARLLTLTLPRAHRPVIVSTEHNTWDSYGRLTRWLNAATCGLDAARWAVSKRVEASVWPRLRRRTSVLVHGLVLSDWAPDREKARVSLRSEWGAGKDDVVLCTVANFRPNKSYPNLLNAARLVIDRTESALFVAVGQGPLKSQVHELHQRLDLGDRFRLLGYRRDVPDILAACDAFVLASEHEGFPIAVMEALSAGLPVVATAVGGVPDAVVPGREGLLVPPHDPEALAEAILELVNDPPRRRGMALAASRRGDGFDMRGAARAIEDQYLRSGGRISRVTAPAPSSNRD